MNNKQVLSALLTSAMILISMGAVSAGTGGMGEETWYTHLLTTQTPPLLMFDSLLNDQPSPSASSTTVTLTAVADATVKSWQPDSNFGSESVLSLSYSDIDVVNEAVTLLRFDVASALPEGAIIDSASLELFLMDGSGADPALVAAYFVTSSWAESSVTWNLFPTAEPIGVISQVDRSPGSYKSWQVTSFAQEWQSGSNDGVFLRGPVDGTYYERTFESREHNESVPRLVVTYHLPSPAYTFTGNVYQGSPPETDTPAGGVTVELWGDEDEWPEAGFARVLLTSTATGDAGEFSLSWEEGDTYYPYLHVIEVDPPGTYSTGAQAGEPGNVTNFNVVSYLDIPPGTYGGIAFWDQLPEEKPDLIIIDAWNENGTICYLIENIGDGVAPGGHCTALSVDGLYRGEDCMEGDLAPGAGMERCFEYGWECSPPEDVVVVCADHRGDLEERDEDNSCTERVFGCPPGEKPDLVVTDLWNEEGTICYQIRNIGGGVAPGGHYTALIVDDEYRVCDPVDQELEPGERLRGCFDYDWECTSPEDLVVVVADYEEGVAEDNETNNPREEVWKCDVIPPQIVYGPIVQDVTEESAVILWETDEDSDSVVRCGKTARRYALEEIDPALAREHSITLPRLEASTTYNFVVRSTDASGNTVVSGDITFETLPLPDDIDPIVSIIDPGVCQGTVTISADASDDTGVEKVEFLLDDELLFTDYTHPYKFPIDSLKYENGEYDLTAKAYDLSGNSVEVDQKTIVANVKDVTAPSVTITSPSHGDTVSGTITVEANLSDDTGLKCAYLYFTPKGTKHEVYMGFYAFPLRPTEATATFTLYTSVVKDGDYRIGIEVWDKDYNVGYGICDVKVSNAALPDAKLTITKHEITRYQNSFIIELTVTNVGKGEARNIEIWDYLDGFQPVRKISPGFANFEVVYSPLHKHSICEITSHVNIPPGQSRIYAYNAVPILIYPNPPTPQIGGVTWLFYKSPGGKWSADKLSSPVPKTTGGEFISDAHKKAVEVADYLIVTNPGRLYGHYTDDEVDILLSTMAELAYHKQGVMGYTSKANPQNIRNLLKQGDEWSSQMKSGWTKDGYLLIVGETEIIPAWNTKHSYSAWPFYSDKRTVHNTDILYANTAGDWWYPELSVGRIIGNTPEELRELIETSINIHKGLTGYNLDRSHALVVSGGGDGVGKFEKCVDEVAGILDDEFTVTKLKQREVEKAGKNMLTEFKANAKDKDVIFFRDHGTDYSWSGVINTSNFLPIDFGDTTPFAFACCCNAGRYAGITGIAETFLSEGTAVYIGSTEKSKRDANNYAAKKFFNTWVNTPKSIGLALKETKRDIAKKKWGLAWVTSYDSFCRRLWVSEYQLYGDPKLGASSAGSSKLMAIGATEMQSPPSSLDVVIPDYVVITIEGEDYVEIPGGDVLLELDKPLVPLYTVSLDYPQGYRIQDITLSDRSGLVTTTGLHIPITTDDWDLAGSSSPANEGEDWWPEDVFTWTVFENPDGSTTLAVTVAPLYYNPQTTDVRFYRNYSFDISYTVSPVAITTLSTDRDEYEQGDTVMVDIGLNNSGGAQDVIFSASVKRYGSGDTVDGLLLRTLKEFEGIASFTPQWNSDGFEPGYYFVEVTLKDTGGEVLDRKTKMFRLGISLGEIASFTATPECFDIGDEIGIEMAFENNGTVNITGTAVIRVLNSTGDAVDEFRHNVTNLTPSESVGFSDSWDTSGTEAGSSYTIIGYVRYDGKSTDPATITVRNMVMGDLNRDGEVTAADAAIALELAARGEYDPVADVDCDGQITSLDGLMILQAAAGNIELQGCDS